MSIDTILNITAGNCLTALVVGLVGIVREKFKARNSKDK
jgi:hypothetical protein